MQISFRSLLKKESSESDRLMKSPSRTSCKHWKKKRSLYENLKFVLGSRISHLKKDRVRKRRKKKRRSCFQRLLFYIYDWDPGIAPQEARKSVLVARGVSRRERLRTYKNDCIDICYISMSVYCAIFP